MGRPKLWPVFKRDIACVHEIEKSQGSGDFDIKFAMDFELRARARVRPFVVLESMR